MNAVSAWPRIEGVDPLIATAFLAAVGDVSVFHTARQVAGWLGLVTRQHSSGGKVRLLGISKRSDGSLRTLLIHGARRRAPRRAQGRYPPCLDQRPAATARVRTDGKRYHRHKMRGLKAKLQQRFGLADVYIEPYEDEQEEPQSSAPQPQSQG